LTPREIYPVEVEIWPASLALPAGYRLTLTLQGKDFERADATGEQKGSGWFLHNDPVDRPLASVGGTNAIHTGGARESWLLLPLAGS
jgi:predicted acyl esterase